MPPRAFISEKYALAPRHSSVPRPAAGPLNAALMPIFTSRALTPGALAVGASGLAPGRAGAGACARARRGTAVTTRDASPRNRRLFISLHLRRLVGPAQGGQERAHVHEGDALAVARQMAGDQVHFVRSPGEAPEGLETEDLVDEESQLHTVPLHQEGTNLAASR